MIAASSSSSSSLALASLIIAVAGVFASPVPGGTPAGVTCSSSLFGSTKITWQTLPASFTTNSPISLANTLQVQYPCSQTKPNYHNYIDVAGYWPDRYNFMINIVDASSGAVLRGFAWGSATAVNDTLFISELQTTTYYVPSIAAAAKNVAFEIKMTDEDSLFSPSAVRSASFNINVDPLHGNGTASATYMPDSVFFGPNSNNNPNVTVVQNGASRFCQQFYGSGISSYQC